MATAARKAAKPAIKPAIKPAAKPVGKRAAATPLRQSISKLATQPVAKRSRHSATPAVSVRAPGVRALAAQAVLEDAYRRFNAAEQGLVLDSSQPLLALDAMIHFVWTYYQKNPEFITLLNSENLMRGKHIAKSVRAKDYSSPALAITDAVLQAGITQGLFRPSLNARDVYLMIASMAYFYLSNRFTLSSFLGENLEAPAALAHWEAFVIDAVRRVVCVAP